jgi:endonuclease-3
VIREVVRRLAEDDPTLCLDFLREMPTPDVMAYLLALPGVGPKTAACVALFELGRPVFPVDTHILRIAGRLGWVEVGESAEKAQQRLEPFIPARLRLELHLNLIAHGRATCVARSPKCEGCCLSAICDFIHK